MSVAPLAAQVTITSPTDGSAIEPFGPYPNFSQSYGETFIAPAPSLDSWEFWLFNSDALWGGGGDGVTFTANVGTWTGSAVGTLLWTSGTFTGTSSSTGVPYVFDTGGLPLTPGGSYVFFLSASGTGAMSMEVNFSGDQYVGGHIVFNNYDDNFSPWYGYLGFGPEYDAAFVAQFSGPVPEPGAMTLLATGLVGMAGLARRKRRRS